MNEIIVQRNKQIIQLQIDNPTRKKENAKLLKSKLDTKRKYAKA